MEDKQMQKLIWLKNACWKQFEQTGSSYAYGRYKGTQEVIAQRKANQQTYQGELER